VFVAAAQDGSDQEGDDMFGACPRVSCRGVADPPLLSAAFELDGQRDPAARRPLYYGAPSPPPGAASPPGLGAITVGYASAAFSSPGFSVAVAGSAGAPADGAPPPLLSSEHPYGEHPSRTLFIRNISSAVDDSELRALFEVRP
jgi:hypothetical protein